MLARSWAFALLIGSVQQGAIDGTWELARIFRTSSASGVRAVPIDSTTYLRLTLTSHPGGWLSGSVYRRYHGDGERSKLTGGVLGPTGRYALSADFDQPLKTDARTAAWPRGGHLMLGTAFVPDADSVELSPVTPDAAYPSTVVEVVTLP